uniref:hypothetical protein n=1 Tax=Staphylococcus aureus TaxID=1280 RepID=UPI00359FC667
MVDTVAAIGEMGSIEADGTRAAHCREHLVYRSRIVRHTVANGTEVPSADGLAQLGIERIGQLTQMPRAPLRLRFGPEPGLRLDQALGHALEPLVYL